MEAKSIKILLVEDNPDHAELMEKALKRHDPDLTVEVASSGDNCLERLGKGSHDLVLLDYTLPRMNGLEVLARIDKYDVPVIMVTGQGDERVAVEAMKRGAYDYITKSKDYLITLPVVIQKTIDRHRTKEEKKRLEEKLIQTERLRALGEMAGGVAHDFNNILAIILGKTQLLRLTMNKFEGSERRTSIQSLLEGLTTIERAALDAAQTVKRIQEFTRIKREEHFFRMDLNKIVKDACNATKPIWKDQPEKEGIIIKLTMELDKVYPAAGNEAELREVLNNMIFNSLDAMPAGGEIKIGTWSDENYNFIAVSDTGVGMSEDVKGRVFDPFFTTKEVRGSGLGLSVSYGIIARHEGEIEVESEEGKGSTFTIKLPVKMEAVKETKTSTVLIEKKPARILVIDDEKEVRGILHEMLTKMGYDVRVASGGKEGLSLFEQFDFDLVLTDLGMPEMSGWEVAKKVKVTKLKTPVALITGWGCQFDDEKLKSNGVDLVIAKPFKMDQITNLIGEAMKIKERM